MPELYKSLCLELDLLLVEIIENMEEHVKIKIQLETEMNGGFVNIAKTRYIKGSSSVTTMQLPTEMSNPLTPQATVVRSESKEGYDFQVVNNLSGDPQKSDNQDGIRKRKTNEEVEEGKDKVKAVNADPIRLFGVLVPQTLKFAQKSFISSLDQIALNTQVQSSLHKKIDRYSRLMELKQKLTT